MDDMADTVARLVAAGPRTPGSDGERRAAAELRRVLRRAGRGARLETAWVHPEWALTHAAHVLLGIVGGVLAVPVPAAGVAVLAFDLLSVLLELTGRGWLVRRLTFLRATQNVVSDSAPAREDEPGHGERRVRLIVCAGYDAGRAGSAYGERVARLAARAQRAARGRLPGPLGWLALALLALLGCAIGRLAGGSGTALGAAQLVPTIALILGLVVTIDVALSPAGPGAGDNASGVAVALALVAALDSAPPRHLDVELVLAGASDSAGAGLRAHLRARRPRLDPARTVVLGLSGCGSGRPVWLTHEGPLFPAPAHRQLLALCAAVARAEEHLGARPERSRRPSSLGPARAAKLPAITLGCRDELGRIPRSHRADDTRENVDARSIDDVLQLVLSLVDALDAQLGA